MKKRWIFKKGRRVVTGKGAFVTNLANKIVNVIKPFCKRIQVVGSIRRKEKNPVDIDIVVIPKNPENKEEIEKMLAKKGKRLSGGEHQAKFKIQGVKVELYYTTSEEWGAALLAYSSRFGASIGLRMVARRKGFKLNQHGLFRRGKRIAGKTEEEIYKALGRPWKKPEER